MRAGLRLLLLPVLLSLCGLLSLLFDGPHGLQLGRVTAELGGHTVVVNDCLRARVAAVEAETSDVGVASFRFAPCRDAEVLIAGDQLTVNGTFYGALNPASVVLVNHGEVVINGLLREPLPPPQ